jgi:hypothetical protein
MCGGRLLGAPREGYLCTRCRAHYSAQHVLSLQKQSLRMLIHHHFSHHHTAPEERTKTAASAMTAAPASKHPITQEETQTFKVKDADGSISEAIAEAHASVQATTQHLEELLGAQQESAPDATTPSATISEGKGTSHGNGKRTRKRMKTRKKIKTRRRTKATLKLRRRRKSIRVPGRKKPARQIGRRKRR